LAIFCIVLRAPMDVWVLGAGNSLVCRPSGICENIRNARVYRCAMPRSWGHRCAIWFALQLSYSVVDSSPSQALVIVLARQTRNVKERWSQELLELGKALQPLVDGFLAMAKLCVVFVLVFGFGEHSGIGGRYRADHRAALRCVMVDFEEKKEMVEGCLSLWCCPAITCTDGRLTARVD
jgi:hypothetical protein